MCITLRTRIAYKCAHITETPKDKEKCDPPCKKPKEETNPGTKFEDCPKCKKAKEEGKPTGYKGKKS